MQVGFIGVGDQGGPMAEAIAEAGFPLHIWARRPEAARPYAALGATIHDNPRALAAAVDLLGLCVVSENDVRQVLFEQGAIEALKPGSIVAIHATVSPGACQAMASDAAQRGLHLIDAPVSGARAGAVARNLLVMVGGEDEPVQRALPVFRSFGGHVAHLGPVGSGQISKIMNNLLLYANIASAAFVLELGEDLGMDRARLRELLLHGTGRSWAVEAVDTVIQPGAFRPTMARKDIALAMDLAAGCGQPRESIQLTAQLGRMGCERLAGGPRI